MLKPRNILFVLSALAFFAAAPVSAQLNTVPAPVQYTVSPELPGPGQKVTISVAGVGSFIGDSAFTWTQNGKTALSGVGATDYSFTAGAVGSVTNVQVRIITSSGGTVAHDFTIEPSLVNLVWEADTSAPPLYSGKPLYSGGSNLRVVAFPVVYSGGARVPASKLSMQWFYDTNAIPQLSGLGRTTFSFAGDQLQQQENVAVDVYYNGGKVAHGEINIPASQPMVLLYDKDPLRGVLYDTALPAAVSLTAAEFTIQAAPYFFDNASLKSGALAYAWTLNGADTTGPQSAQGLLTLRQAGSGQGAATVGVALQNNDSSKYVQAANAVLQIVFGQSSSGSLFGL